MKTLPNSFTSLIVKTAILTAIRYFVLIFVLMATRKRLGMGSYPEHCVRQQKGPQHHSPAVVASWHRKNGYNQAAKQPANIHHTT